ncbi:MAG: AMIN domain-containing protein [Candidatus Riflebacteria bacterium]|nr:AMIN domain-containing protein [Candidatus Riflebacteria bacterium]
MKSMSGYGKVGKSLISKTAFAFLFAMLINLPAGASEKLTELSISGYGKNEMVLFPSHKVNEFNVTVETPEVLKADLYGFELENGNKIIPSPHPKVKFMRVSQVSKSPDVVRATLVLNEQVKATSRKMGDNILIEMTPLKKASTKIDYQPVARNTSSVSNNYGNYEVKHIYSESDNKTILDQKVSLNFEQEDLLTILNALAAKFDLRIFADAGVKGKMSVNAQDVTLRDILKNLLLQRNYQYTLKGRDLTVISFNTDSSRMARELLFKDLSLKDALQTLSKMMNINLIIHESVVDKKVNFYVENLSLDELLDLLIETNGLVKKPHNDNTYIICDKESAGDFGKKQYRTFKLVNSKPEEIINMIRSSKSLSERIDTENFSVNERINSISVYDIPDNISLIEKIIDSVDEKLKQAVIEVKLVEINRTGLKQLGIKLDNYSMNVADIGHLPSNYALPATLDFLEQESKAKVLASPKIRAVHGKKASINIGKVIPVPYYKYENASNSYLGYIPQVYKEYRDVQVGIRLEVTPEISRDNEISMELNTTVDSVLEINDDGQITKSERNTNTYVRVKNGETVVMGGLINENGSETKNSPSLINKIPLLKTLTTHGKTETNSSEMIMLVTPRLVNLDDADEETTDGSVTIY